MENLITRSRVKITFKELMHRNPFKGHSIEAGYYENEKLHLEHVDD
jgi:hypothetical protein